jgi:hypothetical protein
MCMDGILLVIGLWTGEVVGDLLIMYSALCL